MLEYDEDELDSFVEEAQSLIELLEESDGEIEQEIDELLADGENPTQLQKASAKRPDSEFYVLVEFLWRGRSR